LPKPCCFESHERAAVDALFFLCREIMVTPHAVLVQQDSLLTSEEEEEEEEEGIHRFTLNKSKGIHRLL